MRKRQRGPRPVSDEPLSAGRVEYLEQARERVRNRRIRRTALIVVALTLVVLFTTGIVGSSVAMAKDWPIPPASCSSPARAGPSRPALWR